MFLYNVYRVGCEVSPLLLTHESHCSAHRYIFKTDAYFPLLLKKRREFLSFYLSLILFLEKVLGKDFDVLLDQKYEIRTDPFVLLEIYKK